jgi:predicted nucleotidyltransferase
MAQPAPDHPEPAGPPSFEKRQVPEDVFLRVLDATLLALERERTPFLSIGGIASTILGRPRWTGHGGADIDVFVKPQDNHRARDALQRAGFDTEETFPQWLFKASRDGVVVDIIFKSSGDIFLDDEMLARSSIGEFKGRKIRVAPPEDLLIMKAVAFTEETPTYWHDAVGLVSRADLDWTYLLDRARQHGARRILSLLVFAQSVDLVVPNAVIEALFDAIYRPAEPKGGP